MSQDLLLLFSSTTSSSSVRLYYGQVEEEEWKDGQVRWMVVSARGGLNTINNTSPSSLPSLSVVQEASSSLIAEGEHDYVGDELGEAFCG